MKKISILALEQALPMGMVSFFDIFKMAGAMWDKTKGFALNALFDVQIVTIDGKPVNYSSYLEIKPDKSIIEAQESDLILVPSGGYDLNAFSSYPDELISWLQGHNEKGTLIAGGCTGVFLLAESGILNGKNATTNWGFVDLFKKRYPKVALHPKKMMTEDDNILCSGAGTAGMDMCLYIVEKFYGLKVANRCAKILVLERGRHTQAPFAIFHKQKNHSDSDIVKAQDWIETCFENNFQIDDVAAYVGMGLRNFKRRFKNATGESPLVYIQKIRIEAAKNILENKSTGIEQIANQVGYEDVGFFRKLFARYVGISPSLYRQKFNMQLV